MKNKMNNKEGGFIKLIILIIVILVVMKFMGWKISSILDYFNLSWDEIASWPAKAIAWFMDLFNSVK